MPPGRQRHQSSRQGKHVPGGQARDGHQARVDSQKESQNEGNFFSEQISPEIWQRHQRQAKQGRPKARGEFGAAEKAKKQTGQHYVAGLLAEGGMSATRQLRRGQGGSGFEFV